MNKRFSLCVIDDWKKTKGLFHSKRMLGKTDIGISEPSVEKINVIACRSSEFFLLIFVDQNQTNFFLFQ
jgi:hypothetical protein